MALKNKIMEEKEQKERNRIWDARIVLTFKKSTVKLNILVLAESKTSAEEKAMEWSKKYAEENYKSISNRIGHDAHMDKPPRVQVFVTSYCALI
jgi:hypothetical protein